MLAQTCRLFLHLIDPQFPDRLAETEYKICDFLTTILVHSSKFVPSSSTEIFHAKLFMHSMTKFIPICMSLVAFPQFSPPHSSISPQQRHNLGNVTMFRDCRQGQMLTHLEDPRIDVLTFTAIKVIQLFHLHADPHAFHLNFRSSLSHQQLNH